MFAVISLYTLDGHCYLLVGCAWSLWSLLFPAEIRMVIMFPYACFVRENLSSLSINVALHGQPKAIYPLVAPGYSTMKK